MREFFIRVIREYVILEHDRIPQSRLYLPLRRHDSGALCDNELIESIYAHHRICVL